MHRVILSVMFVSLVSTPSNAWTLHRASAAAKRLLSTRPRVWGTASQQLAVPDGLCPVYKPRDWTSNDVVQKCRAVLEKALSQANGRKTKVCGLLIALQMFLVVRDCCDCNEQVKVG